MTSKTAPGSPSIRRIGVSKKTPERNTRQSGRSRRRRRLFNEDLMSFAEVAGRGRDDGAGRHDDLAPCLTACRTSSSHTKSTAAGSVPSFGEVTTTCASAWMPLLARNASMRVASVTASSGAPAAVGATGRAAGEGAGADASAGTCDEAVGRAWAGRSSYASRLMLTRCIGVMLSEVMLPPKPPQPSVMAGSRPVVSPMDPWVVGVLTTIRNAGLCRPNCRITSSSVACTDIVWPMPP